VHRTDIIQAAAEIFRKKGFLATSMQDIADAVHLQKASLYHHVTSKQEILLEILEQALDLLIADMRAVVDSDLYPEEKLKLAMQVYVGRLTQEADLAAVLLFEHRYLEPRLRTRHIAKRDRYEQLWRDLIRQGVETGAYRPVDVPVVVFGILGVQNWLVTWYREGGRLTSLELADAFSDLFLRGLRAEWGAGAS
jgi:AcrR family transcriptional regulator